MQIFGRAFWVIVYFHVSCTDSTKLQRQTKDEFGTENISTTTIRSSSASVQLAQEKRSQAIRKWRSVYFKHDFELGNILHGVSHLHRAILYSTIIVRLLDAKPFSASNNC
jgi:hypothetical protein